MPESEGPDSRREIEAALERLAAAVDRAASDVEGSRRRARAAQTEADELREATGASGDGDPDPERLRSLTEENRVLRKTLAEALERAERLRSRLFVVEDEV